MVGLVEHDEKPCLLTQTSIVQGLLAVCTTHWHIVKIPCIPADRQAQEGLGERLLHNCAKGPPGKLN